MNSAAVSRPALAVALGAVTASLMLGTASPAEAATLKQTALNIANAQKGDPYQYGAAGPDRFDCSGLTFYSYKKAGKTISRTAQAQYNNSRHISWRSRQKGDLVAIGRDSKHVTHIGMYAGYWQGRSWMVNANSGPYRGFQVAVAPINEYLGQGRHAYYAEVK
ncbi:C40 family peptidase [Streptomyces mirabilis]|uniref:C40 family peptidase n=1 Tax=Streptomyces mirabilis TaxID=68239 RepID=UPI0036CAD74E